MVDAIKTGGGTAGIAADPRLAAAARTSGPTAATPVVAPVPAPTPTPSATDTSQLAALAKAVAASAPVDTDRVAKIKSALANGTFPILPATIADQMMAFRYEWISHDQA